MMTREVYLKNMLIVRKRSSRRKFFLFRYFTKRAVILFVTIFLLAVSLFFVTSTFAAEQENPRTKTITSVQIEAGDSLWTLAEEDYSPEFGSMERYISEIKQSNGLTDDVIHSGAYLIIPYYTDAR